MMLYQKLDCIDSGLELSKALRDYATSITQIDGSSLLCQLFQSLAEILQTVEDMRASLVCGKLRVAHQHQNQNQNQHQQPMTQ
jgi:hypothetical protein